MDSFRTEGGTTGMWSPSAATQDSNWKKVATAHVNPMDSGQRNLHVSVSYVLNIIKLALSVLKCVHMDYSWPMLHNS